MIRYSLLIKGIVQGVGFRPYIFQLAKLFSIRGYVQNTSEGVYAEIEGRKEDCDSFITALKEHPPDLARIRSIEVQSKPPGGDTDFVIIESRRGTKNTLISPDIGICDACAADIADKNNRRYRYAFTNCTDCGPRFTIIRDIPYDRENTTMAEFIQCPECHREYNDPYDRRFHAQPNACPLCGPKLCFYKAGKIQPGDPYALFDECMRKGEIVAVKGIGGYHLACDAKNADAVARLRKNKFRYDKPFAVMMRDIETVKSFCNMDEMEEAILLCNRKPIVLLEKKEDCKVAKETAPNNRRLGVMLPYTPLHCIIMENHDAIVMTSANISDCPMIFDDSEAMNRLFSIADAVLTHNRQIFRRMDDSVCMVVAGKERMIRRSRGFAPEPLELRGNNSVILALGPQQKNTFCLVKGENAFMSGHIGDLDDMDTEKSYESEIQSYIRLFDAKPDIIACDMHPDYISTRYARKYAENMRSMLLRSGLLENVLSERGLSKNELPKNPLPVYKIQHHHAHFASVLAEHNIERNAIGLIFDGTGYGEDGTLWGGEVLLGGIGASERIGHMRYAPLLGGEAAIHEPWRMALAMMNISCGETTALDFFNMHNNDKYNNKENSSSKKTLSNRGILGNRKTFDAKRTYGFGTTLGDKAGVLLRACERGINSPVTSSAGRLFDAVAALAGIRTHASYEGQAAIELEQAIDNSADGSYGFDIEWESNIMVFDWRQLISDIVKDVRKGLSSGKISAKFHRAMVHLLVDAAILVKKQYECNTVVLSGGVFQNVYLLSHGLGELEKRGFNVYSNEKIPANDGGISYGQAAVASRLAAKN